MDTTLLKNKSIAGEMISIDEALWLYRQAPINELLDASEEITQRCASKAFHFCGIVNAKSGACTEDCQWCAQSRHWNTQVTTYDLLSEGELVKEASRQDQLGISQFSLVTSGRKLNAREFRALIARIHALRKNTSIGLCASLGLLNKEELKTLKEAGVIRYHCNLETAPSRFKAFCSSHSVEDKMKTLQAAREAGLALCSGGIIGMGESEKDRIELALALRALKIESIPLNILSPIVGTPLEKTPLLSDEDILKTIALFRFINPCAQLRFAGGRKRLSEKTQKEAFRVGINAAITGDLLTTSGAQIEQDRRLIKEVGYASDDIEFDRKHLWHPYTGTLNPLPVYKVQSAQGTHIKLSSGQTLIDGISSWWCTIHGYSHPKLQQAMHEQIDLVSHVMFGGLTHDPAIRLAKKLLPLVPHGLEKIFFSDSGSVAIEVAMKMAIQYQVALGHSQKTNFATLRQGYHGDTWNAMSVCDPTTGMHTLFGTSLPIRHFLPSPKSYFGGPWDPSDLAPLQALLERQKEHIAALILEPIVQGAGAMRFYHPLFLKEALRLCHEAGVLLIADEIATGFGRTGKLFACNHADITPDIMTVGKGLTGGMMTLSATLTTNEVADAISLHAPHAFMHGPTFMANPLACAVACASLDLLKENHWMDQVQRLEEGLIKGLEAARGLPGVKDVRVLGSIGVIEMDHPVNAALWQKFFVQAGVWVRPFSNLVYLMPAYVISAEDLETLTRATVEAVKTLGEN